MGSNNMHFTLAIQMIHIHLHIIHVMLYFTHIFTANDVTNFPSTIDNTNGDGSTTSGTATLATVSLTTMEANNGGTSTFTLVFSSPGNLQSITYGYQSPVTQYGRVVESGTQNSIFTINGENVLTISMLSIREVASCDVISYKPSENIISLRVPGIPSQFQRESISEYFYIDPVYGRAYEFTNNKVTFETGPGILFVNTATNVAVFSQRSLPSELILRFVSRTFRVEVIDNSLSLRLQLSRIFPLSGTIEIEHMNEYIYYTGGTLITNITSVAANNLIVFGNNGFEALDSTGETVIPIYSDIYFNPVNSEIFVSTNSKFSDLISGLLEFLQSNTPQDGVFMVSGEYVTYQGVNIIRLTNMTTTSVFSPPTILYSGNSLFGSQTIDDVFFVMFQSGGEITVSASSSEAPIFYFTAATIYISEGKALVTDSQQTQTLVADALNDILTPVTPVFPVILPDLVICRLTRIDVCIYVLCVGNPFELLILKIIFPVSFITFNTEETIMYNDGTLSFSSTTIPNVTNVTVVNGEGVLLLSPPLTGYSKDIDSSYILYSNEGLAVLTNQTDLINLIDSSNTFVSIVTLEGQQFLYIGDLQVIRLNNIRRIELTSFQDIIAVTGGGIVVSAEGRVLFNEAVDKFVVYRNNETIPLEMFMMGQPIFGPGSFYVNETDSCAFYTDRLDIINAIENVNQLEVSLVIRSGGEAILTIGGQEIITVNECPKIDIPVGQLITYDGNTVIIRDAVTNAVIQMFSGITMFTRYSTMDTSPQTISSGTITPSIAGCLFLTPTMAFFTNRDDVLNVLNIDIPLVVRSRIIDGETVLNIGKEDIIQLTGSRRFVVTSNQRIEYSGNTIVIRDTTTNEIIETFTNITSSYRYSQSNDIPELDTGGGITVVGPITIIISNDTTLITDRSEVLNVVDPIIPPTVPPSQMFRIEERSDGSFVLVINEMDIITISDAMKQIVESTEQLSYSSNTITITNFISSDELNRILATTLVIYRNTDVEPLNFTGNAPNVYNGPFTLCYTPDGVAFFTNRQDIVMLICDTLNNITTPPPTTATTTPTPDIFPSPQTIIIRNSDRSRWFTGQFSSVRT